MKLSDTFSSLVNYFKTSPDKELIQDEQTVKKIYERKRLSMFITLVIGYGFFYLCRLSFSIAKKPMLDEGILDPTQMGIIGGVLLYVYGSGKFINGILADYANIRKFMSIALFCSAIINLLFGMTSLFALFIILWALNGWFQSIGSAPSVVSLCQWFSNKERGTRYGLWAGAHNIGEGLSFVGTSFLVSLLGWRWGFIGPGIACLIMAAVMFLFLTDRPETYGLPNVADFKKDYSAGKPSNESITKLQLMILKKPIIWILGLSSALMYVCRYGIHSWGPLYLQEVKGYSIAEAGVLIGANTIIGLLGAVSSGFLSDKFFQSKRNIPTLLYGLLLISSLIMLFLVPPGNYWLDYIAIAIFEFAIGGLIVFLAGLIAIDVMPKKAAGAVKGLIGLFSYAGAATQDWISGLLIDSNKTITEGITSYNFDNVFYFWIGASVVSLLLALSAWNIKPQE